MGAEPSAPFSTCFVAPFMPRHPSVYAKMLGEKMAATGANCWLVNTGWTGGAYGTGARMKIAYTRAMVRAALDGRLGGIGVGRHPPVGLPMPGSCPEVTPEVLNPRNRPDERRVREEWGRQSRIRWAGGSTKQKSHQTKTT